MLAEQLTDPITLRINDMSARLGGLLSSFLSKSSSVSYLNCAGAGIGQCRTALLELSKVCKSDRALRHLDLTNNGLGSDGARCFCEALANHFVLEYLVLAENHIGSHGALRVAEM